MEQPEHSLAALFEQLGLGCDEAQILAFIHQHAPLPSSIELSQAPFWSPAQASFLREQWLEDADWAEVIDQLNVLLRA